MVKASNIIPNEIERTPPLRKRQLYLNGAVRQEPLHTST